VTAPYDDLATARLKRLADSCALQGDDIQLEYYEDGYPKLPEFLDRRRKLAEAA
jgi:hypothetical protein